MEILEAIQNRWSPREYVKEAIPESDLKSIFEASLATPSSFNEQPWRFLIATPDQKESRTKLESLLNEGNAFAKQAWVLGLSFGKKNFDKNGKPNRHYLYDVGAASLFMSLRALELGYATRFMAGFNMEKAQAQVSAEFEPGAMFVIGKAAPNLKRPERVRNPLSSCLFLGEWGKSFGL
jgi:nitroreductase